MLYCWYRNIKALYILFQNISIKFRKVLPVLSIEKPIEHIYMLYECLTFKPFYKAIYLWFWLYIWYKKKLWKNYIFIGIEMERIPFHCYQLVSVYAVLYDGRCVNHVYVNICGSNMLLFSTTRDPLFTNGVFPVYEFIYFDKTVC